MMDGYGAHGWGMGWGWITGLAILIIIVWLIVRRITQNSQSLGSNKTPIDILEEKYAKGEIDKQEFDERKRNLM